MKNIVIYSPDFSLCYSFLMYLQSHYKVVTTTNLDVVSSLISSNSADLVILDTEPNSEIQIKCEEFKKCKADIPLILTYVYDKRVQDSENNIKRFINGIFYKPFDLNEITSKIPALLATV